MLNTRNHSLDILKLVLAYEVVMLHCSQAPYGVVRPIVDSAVPCFFMISGYLIYSDNEYFYKEKLKRAIKKISIILIWSTLLCGMNDFYKLIAYHNIGNFTIYALFDFILFNENPFAFHLWYISAYLYTLVFYWILVRKNVSISFSWIIGLWIAGIALVILYFFFQHVDIRFTYVRNFLFQGIPFFGIGLLLRKHNERFDKLNVVHVGILLLFMIVMAVLVKKIESYSIETYAFSGILAFFTLLLFSKIYQVKEGWFAKIGKEDGLYIYIFHPLVMNLLKTDVVMSNIGYSPYLFSTIVFVLTIIVIRLVRIICKKMPLMYMSN